MFAGCIEHLQHKALAHRLYFPTLRSGDRIRESGSNQAPCSSALLVLAIKADKHRKHRIDSFRLHYNTTSQSLQYFNTAAPHRLRGEIFSASFEAVWHVLLSLCLNAVAACSMLKESHCDKWPAGVPVTEGMTGRRGRGVLPGSPLILLDHFNHFFETFPPNCLESQHRLARPGGGTTRLKPPTCFSWLPLEFNKYFHCYKCHLKSKHSAVTAVAFSLCYFTSWKL